MLQTHEPARSGLVEQLSVPSLGWRFLAERIARRAERGVAAYRQFVAEGERQHGFDDRPVTSKANYILRFPTSQLLAQAGRSFAIFRSSGASGKAVYWPYLKLPARYAAWGMRRFLKASFAIHRKRTLAVVGVALGSWVGGDQISWVLKSAALRARYNLSVFTAGTNHAEILEIIADAEPRVEQIILFVCPSHIPHLHLRAEALGKTLPLDKLRYIITGESIPESVRLALQARAGVPPHEPFMFSLYASADTGILGAESLESVALRKLLTLNEGLASNLGFSQPIPHFFHYAALDAYLESMGGELHVTRWQGIPIVRYNLQDRARFYSWRALRRAVLKSGSIANSDEPLRQVIRNSRPMLSDLIALEGRSDALILGGSNFSQAMLDEVVGAATLGSYLTGMYMAGLVLLDGLPALSLELELLPGVTLSPADEN